MQKQQQDQVGWMGGIPAVAEAVVVAGQKLTVLLADVAVCVGGFPGVVVIGEALVAGGCASIGWGPDIGGKGLHIGSGGGSGTLAWAKVTQGLLLFWSLAGLIFF